MVTALAILSLVLAAIPAWQFTKNVRRYRTAPPPGEPWPTISILIPARNEELCIRSAVEAALASRFVHLEVIVLDDHSDDSTAAIVRSLMPGDPRLRLESAAALPTGWAGKQHACAELARFAKHEHMLYIDADVRLVPEAAARLVAFRHASHAALVSGIPHQITGSLAEKLVIPLIHFLLLGFLPIGRMRRSCAPAYGAGCGQLFLTSRQDYKSAGGHAAIRGSFHDGLQLPRAYRRAGLMTDICDATDLANCRMYHNAGELARGLAKNAGEGLGSAFAIVPWTIILGLGQVTPFMLLICWSSLDEAERLMVVVATGLAYWPRILAAVVFRQSWLGALAHPIGILALIAIQWYAFVRRIVGRPIGWKGRTGV